MAVSQRTEAPWKTCSKDIAKKFLWIPRKRFEEQEKDSEVRKNGERHFTEDGRVAQITIDLVLQARAKMAENKVNGPEDSIASEVIKQLPQENFLEITRCFQDRCMELEEASSPWAIVKLVFLRNLDAEPKNGIRSYRAIASTLLMSRWSATSSLGMRSGARGMDAGARGWH